MMINDLTTWVEAHSNSIQLLTVWVWCLCYFGTAAGFFIAWLILRKTNDQTPLGAALKGQKAALAVLLGVSSGYWGAVLYLYYTGAAIGIWTRITITVVIMTASIVGLVYAARFVVALVRESRRERTGSAPLAMEPVDDDGGEA